MGQHPSSPRPLRLPCKSLVSPFPRRAWPFLAAWDVPGLWLAGVHSPSVWAWRALVGTLSCPVPLWRARNAGEMLWVVGQRWRTGASWGRVTESVVASGPPPDSEALSPLRSDFHVGPARGSPGTDLRPESLF